MGREGTRSHITTILFFRPSLSAPGVRSCRAAGRSKPSWGFYLLLRQEASGWSDGGQSGNPRFGVVCLRPPPPPKKPL